MAFLRIKWWFKRRAQQSEQWFSVYLRFLITVMYLNFIHFYMGCDDAMHAFYSVIISVFWFWRVFLGKNWRHICTLTYTQMKKPESTNFMRFFECKIKFKHISGFYHQRKRFFYLQMIYLSSVGDRLQAISIVHLKDFRCSIFVLNNAKSG